MSKQPFYLNGINGATGQYLTPPVDPAEAAARARGEPPPDPDVAHFLRDSRQTLRKPFMALPFNIDPLDVTRSGWAVVFPQGTAADVQAALEPLIAHRRARVPADRCKELDYRAGESMRAWLQR